MSYFVYILRTSSNTLYIGQTNNLEKRLKEHRNKSSKSAKYIRYFSSFTLVYSEKYSTRKEAMHREAQLKKLSKAEKEAVIVGDFKPMKKLLTSNKVYIGKSGILNADRGVYARGDIKKGEIIETSPIIEVPQYNMSNLKGSILVTYFFYFGKNKERLAIALGFGSIYNHSYKPNITYKIKPKEKLIDFIALDDINKDDELTFNYHNSSNLKSKKRPLWFEKV